jgi:hypothetical protein
MADLLLHSMAEFTCIILPSLEIAGAKQIVEIGSEYGEMTEKLIEYTGKQGGELISIDPSPLPQAEKLFKQHPHARLIQDMSLNVLGEFDADAYLVDGDHNYYTVYNELVLSWGKVQKEEKHYLGFFHDVGWPCGKRDIYYNPDRIPGDFLQPYAWDKGVTLDNPGVIDGGFRGEGVWAVALNEGGPRNGILTAIDDFVMDKTDHFLWAYIPVVFGLGILYDRHAPWVAQLTRFLFPFHDNSLLSRLERNRLECYLKVIEWQDRYHEENI